MAAVLTACAPAQPGGHVVTEPDGTQWHPMSVERLPDLNEPRGSHRTLALGDEIVVLGGHTDGFKPIETAEYYANGAWHTIPMLYPHENGFAAPLPDGRVLLGGGSQEAFGIGQSWGAEVYDPAAHQFTAVGIMTAKRAMSSALTQPDGRVVIVGNWRAPDSYETWTPENGFTPGERLDPGWAEPYIFPASLDDIIIFGPWDPQGGIPGGRVDHLGGEPEWVPLLEEWEVQANYHSSPLDLQVADYTYLIPARNRSTNECAILKLAGGVFSLLEMDASLPERGPEGNSIEWRHLQVDRPARLIWMQGMDSETGQICFARISYDATFDGGKATMTLYYAIIPGEAPSGFARLLPGGRLVLAGGLGWKTGSFPIEVDNFKTFSSVFVFHSEQPEKENLPLWAILAGILVLGGGVVMLIVGIQRRRRSPDETAAVEEGVLSRNLMEQISTLIEEKELYRRKDLRITDLASELATNKTYISVLLNKLSGESFTSLITKHRIQYAQRLLREHPDMILDDVADQSGFSSRTTFFRNFKAVTGMTPQEWKRENVG